MYDDYYTKLSTDQVLAGSGEETEENLDWGRVAPNLGEGTKVRMRVTVKADVVFNAATKLQFQIRDSGDDITYAMIASGPELVEADLVKGAIFEVPLPNEHRRYLQGYIFADDTITSGTIDADLIAG